MTRKEELKEYAKHCKYKIKSAPKEDVSFWCRMLNKTNRELSMGQYNFEDIEVKINGNVMDVQGISYNNTNRSSFEPVSTIKSYSVELEVTEDVYNEIKEYINEFGDSLNESK